LTALLAIASATIAEELVTLQTRDNVTLSFLLTVPADSKPAAAAILFPGSQGHIRLRNEGGQIKLAGGNFLVRWRQQFVGGGIATAVVDTPSDQPQGMEDWFRLGDKHAADITRVVEELKRRYPGIPVFLVGTSRGSVSAAATGGVLGETVAGVVLTSSMFVAARSGPALSGFDYAKIKAPVLLVHHAEDSCFWTPYREARKLAETRHYPLISVSGGKPATSDPCEPFSAHGFLGKEPETVEAMVNWMLKKPYRTNID
jgi:pimeloyl-ACP methyl ester carboxylesterase